MSIKRTARAAVAALIVAGVSAAAPLSASAATRPHPRHHDVGATQPTVVLVHGAWADSGSWDRVIRRLQRDGYTVWAPPNQLTGLANDSAAIADFLHTITGPIVLVGHSFAVPDLTKVFNFVPFPGAPSTVVDAYVKQSVFPGCFANGLPAREGAELAATQRPLATNALTDPSGPPAWTTIPSWDVVGTADHVIPLADQLSMAHNAGAHITEIDAPHLSMIADPTAVTNVIEQAANRPG